MRWTEDQYQQYQQQRRNIAPVMRQPQRMNKTEAAFAMTLDILKLGGGILDYWYESLKFRLADRTWYTPDFLVIWADGRIEVVEVKGFLRDDAAVKFKACRDKYPWLEWRMMRRRKTEWERVM